MFLIELVYLIWLCPYELAGDEGHYRVQARHLDLSLQRRAALPWLIAGCCRLFGDTEWAVRLPVLLSFIAAAWAVGNSQPQYRTVISGPVSCGGHLLSPDARISSECDYLHPGWTTDLAFSGAGGNRTATDSTMERGKPTWRESMLFWGVLGIGILFKPNSAVPAEFGDLRMGRETQLERRASLIAEHAIGVLLMGVIVSPMILWNSRHEAWPLLEHTAGHLGAGGDQTGQVNSGNAATWLGMTVGGSIGAFGPAAVGRVLVFGVGVESTQR